MFLSTFLVVFILNFIPFTFSRPIIGIFTLPCDKYSCPTQYEKRNYISASYVKWIESGGAQVVPIFHNSSYDELARLIPQLNGVVFTGGAVSFSSTTPWIIAIDHTLKILRSVSKESHGKNVIPLWSTCLGFEGVITQVAKAGFGIRGNADAEGLDIPVKLVPSPPSSTRFFNPSISKTANVVAQIIQTKNTTVHYHKHGIDPKAFDDDEYLKGNFTLVGVSYDRNNVPFVSMFETRPEMNLAWYGSQFHPEKPPFEWVRTATTHTRDAIMVSQYLASFFVSECASRNSISMDPDKVNELVIYNYRATYEGKPTGPYHAFTEVYLL